jgi:putative transposase
VRLTRGVLGFRPQAFCKWRANPVTGRERTDAHLTSALAGACDDDPEFRLPTAGCSPTSCAKPGTRSVNDGSGACNRSRACSRSRRRRAAKAKPAGLDRQVHHDRVQRDFTAIRLGEWLAPGPGEGAAWKRLGAPPYRLPAAEAVPA